MVSELRKQVNETVTFLRTKTGAEPQIGIILGTGLGALVKDIDIELEILFLRHLEDQFLLYSP